MSRTCFQICNELFAGKKVCIWHCSDMLLCNQNQVSVSGTETKVQFQYQCQSRNFFFQNRKHFCFKIFQIFSCFPVYWVFKSLKLNIFRNNLKIFDMNTYVAANLVLGTLLWWKKWAPKKIPRTIGNQIFSLICGFVIGYSMGWKYWPIWVTVSVSNLNQNSGLGHTLWHACH